MSERISIKCHLRLPGHPDLRRSFPAGAALIEVFTAVGEFVPFYGVRANPLPAVRARKTTGDEMDQLRVDVARTKANIIGLRIWSWRGVVWLLV